MNKFVPDGLGWQPDLPDPLDYEPGIETIAKMLEGLPPTKLRPERADWREYCDEVTDQQWLRASSAHACLGLIQYFERRANGHLIEPSAMFVYKRARHLAGCEGNSAVGLRTTLKAIARYGAPPDHCWPYEPDRFDEEPEGFLYSYSRKFQSLCYLRLDGRGRAGEEVLETVLSFLAAGFPCVFGFPVFNSLSNEAEIPCPTNFDRVRGGQAVMAVGYDDNRRYRSVRGTLLIRNSWGRGWGDRGYGHLPYAYASSGLARDFWTVLDSEWLASGEFRRPAELTA
ncbi:MAG: C1 family peptidase [Rhodopirellula sp.]|nr:C1 family peptidase [Rhodopirellula sp.]